jgi:hypothetical protein
MLGLIWDVIDAAAYFCSQRRARLQRVRVPARCPERDALLRQCLLDVGHAEQHSANGGVWAWVVGNRSSTDLAKVCPVHCRPSCSFPKCGDWASGTSARRSMYCSSGLGTAAQCTRLAGHAGPHKAVGDL